MNFAFSVAVKIFEAALSWKVEAAIRHINVEFKAFADVSSEWAISDESRINKVGIDCKNFFIKMVLLYISEKTSNCKFKRL